MRGFFIFWTTYGVGFFIPPPRRTRSLGQWRGQGKKYFFLYMVKFLLYHKILLCMWTVLTLSYSVHFFFVYKFYIIVYIF